MKTIGVLFVVGAMVAGVISSACSDETVVLPPSAPVNWLSLERATVDAGALAPTARESNAAQDYLTALGSNGFARLVPLFADDARFSFPGMDDAHDRNGAIRAHDALFGAFDQRSFVASRIWRTAGEQTAEWTMSGVQSRGWMGVAPTQKSVTIKGITLLWTNDDGTLADVHVYFDVAATKTALGAGPKELAGLAAPPALQGPPQIIDQRDDGRDNVAVVRKALDAFESRNESAFLGQMADDVEVHTPERTDPTRGKGALLSSFRAMHKAIAQLDTTELNGWSVGSFAIVEYAIAGEQIGPLEWVPVQRDNVVKKHVVDVADVRDGKIAGLWRYENPAELLVPGPVPSKD